MDRLNGTAMDISFTPLTIVEAKGIIEAYSISYRPLSSRKRQGPTVVNVPAGRNNMVITGLNPDTGYAVSVCASTSSGLGVCSEPRVVHPRAGL